VSVQKQPTANTVDVAEGVIARLAELRQRAMIPADLRVDMVSNQAVYVRQSIDNASLAALAGALLAMIVVYCFLGSVRGTLRLTDGRVPIAPTIGTLRRAAAQLSIDARGITASLDGRLGAGSIKLTGHADADPTLGVVVLVVINVLLWMLCHRMFKSGYKLRF